MKKAKKPTRAEARTLILSLFKTNNDVGLPLLIGPASLALGPYWGLKDTESVFVELLMRGDIRQLNAREKWDNDCEHAYFLAGVELKGEEEIVEAEVSGTGEVAPVSGPAHGGASDYVRGDDSQVRATGGVPSGDDSLAELCVGYPDGD